MVRTTKRMAALALSAALVFPAAAGTAASLAVEKGVAVQDVPYGALSGRLRADGQVLEFVKSKK